MDLISRAWSVYSTQWTWPLRLAPFAAVILIVALCLGYKACNRPPKLNIPAINKINSKDRQERKAELQNIIDENAEVITTVDERSTIAETNVIERNRIIDEKIADADKKIDQARKQGHDVTSEELECILVPEHCGEQK